MRYALVTGANKGIGLEIWRQLASDGVSVVLTARDPRRGVEAVEKLRSYGLHNVIYHQLDLLNSESIDSLAKFVKNHFGKLDILVDNAGVGGAIVDWENFRLQVGQAADNVLNTLRSLTKQTYELAEECLKTNYHGTKEVTESLLPYLLLSESETIVNVSGSIGKLKSIPNGSIGKELNDNDSLTSESIHKILQQFLQDFNNNSLETKGWPTNQAAYTVSKAALNAYTRILAKENPRLHVNCVCPGFVKTDMTSNVGVLTFEEGARGPVKLALLPKDGPSGQFFDVIGTTDF